jgi:hypothetical protein
MPIEFPLSMSTADRAAVETLLRRVGTKEPTLQQIWFCLDAVWDELGCNNRKLDPIKIATFYSHPVWLLNGLFAEQDFASLRNREIVADWIAKKQPRRIADFGGGFGTLARMVAAKCPQAHVEVIEPFPHPVAIEQSSKFSNVTYVKSLSGSYDAIIAMDVFEHVNDPLGLVHETAPYLRNGGIYLTANNFYPVIKCHLPVTFHFRHSWKRVMKMMNLRHIEDIIYGSAFQKTGNGGIVAVRVFEFFSRLFFPITEPSRALRSRLKLRTRLGSFLS